MGWKVRPSWASLLLFSEAAARLSRLERYMASPAFRPFSSRSLVEASRSFCPFLVMVGENVHSPSPTFSLRACCFNLKARAWECKRS